MDQYTALYIAGLAVITFDGVMLGTTLLLAIAIALAILLVTYNLEHLFAKSDKVES